jgi:hypothetical protein
MVNRTFLNPAGRHPGAPPPRSGGTRPGSSGGGVLYGSRGNLEIGETIMVAVTINDSKETKETRVNADQNESIHIRYTMSLYFCT